MKNCLEIRVEVRRSVGRLRETWLESVEADISELDIDREDIRTGRHEDGMLCRGSPTLSKMDYKPIVIIISTSFLNTTLT